ncbi:MAG: DUF4492 domain-containing protein [Mediterranea sp.]|jgi:hypothetical protein|nr:DUF4492 domain-containing protein [Mediterranea sp.]
MKNAIKNIWQFYLEGFRGMTLGRTLWLIIVVKLIIMFLILRPIFFPNYLNTHAPDGDKDEFVGNELIERAIPSNLNP